MVMVRKNTGWKPLIFLIIVIVAIMVAFFYFRQNSNILLSQNVNCEILQADGDPSANIDIVFLGDNYAEAENFVEDVVNYKDSFLSVVPFNEYGNKFNFYYISGTFDLGCEYDEAILCDPRKVRRISSNCPNDFTVVLSDYNGVRNLFQYLRSSYWLTIAAINTADDRLVLAHELGGHGVGDFADEYDYGGSITWDAPNCVQPDCSAFDVVEDPGCFLGCTNMEHYRECDVCIMSNYWEGKTFGNFNEWYLRNLFEDKNFLTGNVVQESGFGAEDIFFIDFNANYEVENIVGARGYAPNLNKKNGFYLEIEGREYPIGNPEKAFVDVARNGKIEGRIVEMQRSFTVVIPAKGNEGKEVLVLDYSSGEEKTNFVLPKENSNVIMRTHDLSKQIMSPFVN